MPPVLYLLPLTTEDISDMLLTNPNGAVVVAQGMNTFVVYPVNTSPDIEPRVKLPDVPAVSKVAVVAQKMSAALGKYGIVLNELEKISKEINDITQPNRLPEKKANGIYTGAALLEALHQLLAINWKEDQTAAAVMMYRVLVLGQDNANFMRIKPSKRMPKETTNRFIIKQHYLAVGEILDNIMTIGKDQSFSTKVSLRHAVMKFYAVRKELHLLTDAHIRAACLTALRLSNKSDNLPDYPVVSSSYFDEDAVPSDGFFRMFPIKAYSGTQVPFMVATVDHMLRQIVEFDPIVIAAVDPPSEDSWPLLQLPLVPSGNFDGNRLMYPSVNESTAFIDFNLLAQSAMTQFHADANPGTLLPAYAYTGILHVSTPKQWRTGNILSRSKVVPIMRKTAVPFPGTWYTAVVNLSRGKMIIKTSAGSESLFPGCVCVYSLDNTPDDFSIECENDEFVYLIASMVFTRNEVPTFHIADQDKNKKCHTGLFSPEIYQSLYSGSHSQRLYPPVETLVVDPQAFSCLLFHTSVIQRKDILRHFNHLVTVKWTSTSLEATSTPGYDLSMRVSYPTAPFAEIRETLQVKNKRQLPLGLFNSPTGGMANFYTFPSEMPSIQNYIGLITDNFRITKNNPLPVPKRAAEANK